MTEIYSKSRQRAEDAFQEARSNFYAKGQAVEEHDANTRARDEKTLRLREARKAKDVDFH